MLGLRLEGHEVHDVDHPYPQRRDMLAQEGDGAEGLQGGDVTRAGHDDVRLAVFVIAGPGPYPESLGAMNHGVVHAQVLEGRLLAGDDDIDVMAAAQAVIGH